MIFEDKIDKKIYKLYKNLRKETNKTKKRAGFKCEVCGSCCTPMIKTYDWDYYFLKEKNKDISGWETMKIRGSEYPSHLKKRKGKPDHNNPKIIHPSHGCYYEEQDESGYALTCNIHGYNPILCHGYPIVCNLDDFTVWIQSSCNFLEEQKNPLKWDLSKLKNIMKQIRELMQDL